MQILLGHWHCILPVVGIIIAAIFMRDKSKNKKQSDNNSNSSKSNLYGKE